MIPPMDTPGWGQQAYFGCVNRDDSFVHRACRPERTSAFAVAGPEVKRLKCDTKQLPEIPPFATDDCCSSDTPQPPPRVRYAGRRKVTFAGNLSGIVIHVGPDVQ